MIRPVSLWRLLERWWNSRISLMWKCLTHKRWAWCPSTRILESITSRIVENMNEVQEVKSSFQFSWAIRERWKIVLVLLNQTNFNFCLVCVWTLQKHCIRSLFWKFTSEENKWIHYPWVLVRDWTKGQSFLNNKLKIDPKSIETDRAHFTGNMKQKSGKAKPILVEFLRYKRQRLHSCQGESSPREHFNLCKWGFL